MKHLKKFRKDIQILLTDCAKELVDYRLRSVVNEMLSNISNMVNIWMDVVSVVQQVSLAGSDIASHFDELKEEGLFYVFTTRRIALFLVRCTPSDVKPENTTKNQNDIFKFGADDKQYTREHWTQTKQTYSDIFKHQKKIDAAVNNLTNLEIGVKTVKEKIELKKLTIQSNDAI